MIDAERIYALPDRAAREAALLELPLPRRGMVTHFLILKFAAEVNLAANPDALLAGVPSHMDGNVRYLARSYAESARIVARAKAGA